MRTSAFAALPEKEWCITNGQTMVKLWRISSRHQCHKPFLCDFLF
jgi:hypothetical protein